MDERIKALIKRCLSDDKRIKLSKEEKALRKSLKNLHAPETRAEIRREIESAERQGYLSGFTTPMLAHDVINEPKKKKKRK